MIELPNDIARINALTTNARSTWFALLGVLVFVGITLMGVDHIDFYGVNRATTLPLVDVNVPTTLFFYAAPVLTVTIYAYFHLYLIRLWDALSDSENHHEDKCLSDTVSPWLVTHSALYLREKLRKDCCSEPKALEVPSFIWNVASAWLAGPLILVYIWWTSLAARDVLMSGIAAAMISFGLVFCIVSAGMMIKRMARRTKDKHVEVRAVAAYAGVIWVVTSVFMGGITWYKTSAYLDNFSNLVLTGQSLTERPEGWVSHALAKKDFQAIWCKREGERCDDIGLPEQRRTEFEAEWGQRREIALSQLAKPKWSQGRNGGPNFRGASLSNSFLSGADLSGTDMRGADLAQAQLEATVLNGADAREAKFNSAQMEGAQFIDAQLTGSEFKSALMDNADFSNATLNESEFTGARMRSANFNDTDLRDGIFHIADFQGSNFSKAEMLRSNFSDASMQNADFFSAKLQGAILARADLTNADLWKAQLQNSDMSGAILRNASLSHTDMTNANLRRADLSGATLNHSRIIGTPENPSILSRTNLTAAVTYGGAFRAVDMSQIIWDEETDFRNAFLDFSVVRTLEFHERMGSPCQWVSETLDDAEFLSVWRWWQDTLGTGYWVIPTDLQTVAPPTTERLDELGLTDCKPNQPFGPMPATE